MHTSVNIKVILTRIDLWLFHLINGCSGNWPLDWLASFAERSNLAKGAVMMIAYWWLWFAASSRKTTRAKIVTALIGAMISLIVSRVLASVLPYRVRPLYLTDIGYLSPHLPSFARPFDLENWSSFPSDHAALFFALATGLWRCSRKLGTIAFVYATIWVCLVRVYLGIHFPLDVAAGAMIGVACAVLCALGERRLSAEILRIEDRFPAWFYATMFLITFEFATMFDDVRQVMHGTSAALHAMGSGSLGLFVALAVAMAVLVVALSAFGVVTYRRRIRRA